jgi:hypothetical protein
MARAYSVNLQIALNIEVDIQAESFEEAVIRGREMVNNSRNSTHMVKRAMAKTDNAVQVQDTESHFIGVRDNDAGMMYK